MEQSTQREPEPCFTAVGVATILQGQRAAMLLRDLGAQGQTDARSAGLGGEEGNEQVRVLGSGPRKPTLRTSRQSNSLILRMLA